MTPQESLVQHLAAKFPGFAYDIDGIAVNVGGWACFEACMQDTRDSLLLFVVRPDGSVVEDDPQRELGRICEQLELLERPDAVSPEDLATVALCLLGGSERLLSNTESARRWSKRAKGARFKAPVLERTRKGLRLVFWSKATARGLSFTRYDVRVNEAYEVTVDTKQPRVRVR